MIVSKNLARLGAAKRAILEMLRNGEVGNGKDGNRLPSEEELSGIIGVSTGTAREALRILETEGVISKKHGAGNFYHPSALGLKMRIDIMSDFKELLEDAGHTVRRMQSDFRFRRTSGRERTVFGIDGEILAFNVDFFADDKPAIKTVNLVPRELLTAELDEIKQDSTLMELLWRHCRERIAISIEELIPRRATAGEAEVFGLPGEEPIIALDEVFYSFKDTPIGYATVAFNPLIMKMHLLRKWS